MKRIVAGIILAVFMSSSVYGFGTSKFRAEVEKESAAVKLTREVMRGGYDIVTTAELNDIVKNGDDVLIIDTMPYEASYKKGHIPTSKQFLFPVPEMKVWDEEQTGGKSREDFIKLLGTDKEKKIVVYCGFVKCTRSHNGALWAKKLGYRNVFRHPGGIFAWKGAGYEVATVE